MKERDLVIIGAGPAGLAAAAACGLDDVLLLDRLPVAGGMLPQCFHRGFLKDMTGVELAARLRDTSAEVWTDTFVSEIGADRVITAMSAERGVFRLRAGAVILATGCRERPIGMLPVTGTRPSGVYTAGSVQRMINLGGRRFGRRAVILGSGDVGMIVAHHLTETGTEVIAVIEKEPKIGGMLRNKSRYLDPHGIPVLTSCTITELHGEGQLSGVTAGGVRLDCDTLITSVGLIPELELVEHLRPQPDWLFICGNANRVHSMVDSVLQEGRQTGEQAGRYVKEQ